MTSPIITEAVRALVDRRDRTRIEAAAAMEAIMTGAATGAQIGAFLTALRMKGETVEELIGFAQVMRQKVVRIRARGDDVAGMSGTDRELLIDTCGTGGDATGTFNVSTATAFVVAGTGLRVAKHGNRSVSSLCGSADVVETLGISLELPPDKITRCLDEVGIGFLYAPLLHTAMKHVMPARREMGVRTVFNMLGPLTNPAAANAQIIGVYAASLTEPLARVLAELGTVRAFVVHGADNLDEISNTGESRVSEVREGAVRTYVVRPEDFGMARASIKDLAGGNREQNAEIIRAVLGGEPGPRRDIVLMNAAAALVAGARARDLKDGVAVAAQSIDSGAARGKLDALVTLSRRLAGGSQRSAGAQKKTALTGADERGRAGGGLSEAARPLGADREPFARSPSQRSKRRTGSGHPRFPGVSGASRRGYVQGIADRTVFPCPVFAERTRVGPCGPPRPAVQCAHIRRRAN